MNEENMSSILEMANGAIKERADYEMARIIDNILDLNTAPAKKRTLTITAEFIPDALRTIVRVNVTAKSKLEPTNPVATSLYIIDQDDAPTVYEMVPQIPGQTGFSGEEQAEPKILKLMEGV